MFDMHCGNYLIILKHNSTFEIWISWFIYVEIWFFYITINLDIAVHNWLRNKLLVELEFFYTTSSVNLINWTIDKSWGSLLPTFFEKSWAPYNLFCKDYY